jgi:hypothetical protein
MRVSKLHNKTLHEQLPARAAECRRKFLRFFPDGFTDEKYFGWERGYKWNAHEKWHEQLNRAEFRSLLKKGEFSEIAARAVKIESPTNLLFSFEKMALRDAVKSDEGAKLFAEGLDDFLHGKSKIEKRFERWCETVAALPKKQSRVLTHPLVTVFGFLARPETHIFLKPNVSRRAAREYGFDFRYKSKPSWETYASLLKFAELIKHDLADLKLRDMIDVQSFIWVQGSTEYLEE